MPPPSRRSIHRLAVLMLFVLATTTASAAEHNNKNQAAAAAANHAAKADSARKKADDNNAKCPLKDPSACNLATVDDLGAVLEAMLLFLEPLQGFSVSTLTGPSSCEPVVFTGGSQGITAGCGVFPNDEVPSLFAQTACPEGFEAAIESTCAGVMRDGDNQLISFLPVLGQGTNAGTAFCVVAIDSTPLPPDATIEVQQQITCSYDKSVFGLAEGKKTTMPTTPTRAALVPARAKKLGAAAMARVAKALAASAAAQGEATGDEADKRTPALKLEREGVAAAKPAAARAAAPK
jgi:hypothetical protein